MAKKRPTSQPKSESESDVTIVKVRFTTQEKQLLALAAAASGVRASELAHDIVMKELLKILKQKQIELGKVIKDFESQ